ncbi:Uncharacterized protein TPAR_00948 [Tolypocladium paradoxum]|uniref:Protein kinase domain-containing protein n=1 Tax=Tolypocladium paradoxum TaxID=94208 RepID=A0A2S4L8U5_9HYPO|nr:Uncharacterized protein TPAR_00948 [Tolypocladium paradoxum]
MAEQSTYAQSGGFFPEAGLPSPAPSASSTRSTSGLPHPRQSSLRPGSNKEGMVRRYAEERLLNTSRRYVKKFGNPDPADTVVGFHNFGQVCRELDGIVNVLWLSGTPGLQIPFLLRLASDFTQYVRSFPPAPRATFALLGKLDHCFASILSGQDIDSKETLPGFENGLRAGMTVTDMVRCRSLVEQTRVLMVEILSGAVDEEEDDDDETDTDYDAVASNNNGGQTSAPWDIDEEQLHMDSARIYENTIVQLGVRLGDSIVSENVPSNDVVCSSPSPEAEPTSMRHLGTVSTVARTLAAQQPSVHSVVKAARLANPAYEAVLETMSGNAEPGIQAASPRPASEKASAKRAFPGGRGSPDSFIRTTSQGTFLNGVKDGLENLEDYQEGGYHPIHLGDYLGAEERYRVTHKLGHGGFGTVWLCRDERDSKYVAVKVMTADMTDKDLRDLALERLDRSEPGPEYIAIPQAHFSLDGPNGTHRCIVLPVLGQCISPDLWHDMENPAPVLRRMCQQAAQALGFLHSRGICHGGQICWTVMSLSLATSLVANSSHVDFRPANILLKVNNLDHLSEEDLISLLGQPEETDVLMESESDELPPSTPEYLVGKADLSRLGAEYLTNDICIIDFGESFPISSPPPNLGIPENYLPPEILLEDDLFDDGEQDDEELGDEGSKGMEPRGNFSELIGPATDMWALGCTLFEIRQQIPLFYMIYDRDELLAEMVGFFGKPPQDMWDKWQHRGAHLNEDGKPLAEGKSAHTLEIALNHELGLIERDTKGNSSKKSFHTPEEEQKLLGDLLYKIFRYEPSERPSVEEVMEHEWFKLEPRLQ